MRQVYSYTIEASEYDGKWEVLESDSERSARDPQDYARGLLESWIIDHPERLSGGERVEVYDGADAAPEDNYVHVRVSVYRGSGEDRDEEPSAYSYLQYDESEF